MNDILKKYQENFWERYREDLEDGYYTKVESRDCLKSKFIVEYPQEIAKRLKDYRKNKLSQLWKFYDHARQVQDRLRQPGVVWEEEHAKLCELQPAVNYAKERDTVTQEFKDFIDFNVQCINKSKDLEAFIKHFQSVIAYLPRQNQK